MASSKATLYDAYTTIRGVLLILPWLAYLLAADLALSALLPISAIRPDASYNTASALAGGVWAGIQTLFERANRARISVSGAALPRGESAIVVSNHVEWVDFYMIQALAQRAGMLSRCRWFAKQQLRWVPFLGWGLWAMGMPLVSRKWAQDRRELERVFRGIVQRRWPVWLIAYSEATRYTQEKYEEAVAWCKENDKPIPRHTLYPRTRGFIATVSELRKAPHVKAVYDVTIAYADGKTFMASPTFWQTVRTPNLSETFRFHVHVERHELRDLPDTDEGLAKWLEDRWVEKGNRLEGLRVALARGENWPSNGVVANGKQAR